ncbi:MAG: hypothetical protein RIR70_1407 [Pseudomonadota bacterium]|jgi:glutathione synthase/RimK-type ligase-like ATP-grasp enzyme
MATHPLVVIAHRAEWPGEFPGAPIVSAKDYLTDPAFGIERGIRVFNLCAPFAYQRLGYYVSLLAEARGHKPLPRVATIEDLKSPNLVRAITHDLEALADRALAPIKTSPFELSIYFGRNLASRYDTLCKHIFEALPAPLMRAQFERRDNRWRIRAVTPIGPNEVPLAHREFFLEAARLFFTGRAPRIKKREDARFVLGILHDEANPEPPSNARALQKFSQAADALGLKVEFLNRNDYGRLAQFDALFVRDTTEVNHYTYRFARRAASLGLVVIDDPDSILKCNNKVYLAEVLSRHDIPTPKTLLIHRDNVPQILRELHLPVVLKQPDSAFSLGVAKAENERDIKQHLGRLLAKSDLVIAQEWLPTTFDWRVGVLDRRVLFVARYYMVPGHWQIVRHGVGAGYQEGATEAVAISQAPEEVVSLALKSANLIGDGFYGVDIKQCGQRFYVIEVNDNPNVDAGNEDGVLRDALYREVMGTFLRRLEKRRARLRLEML